MTLGFLNVLIELSVHYSSRRVLYWIRTIIIIIIVQRVATKSSLFIIRLVHSTCFWCQPRPSSGVHKTVTIAFGTGQPPPSNVTKLATLKCGSWTKNMTSTGGCSYSFVCYWWWVWLTSETCRVNLQDNKQTALCCISLGIYWYRSAMHGIIKLKANCLCF